MPTYEYACKSCGEHTEAVQSFTDPPLTECPRCGGPLRKVFGNVGITFKGSGFYKTDSRVGVNGRSGAKKDGEAVAGDKSGADADAKGSASSSGDGSAKSGDGTSSTGSASGSAGSSSDSGDSGKSSSNGKAPSSSSKAAQGA